MKVNKNSYTIAYLESVRAELDAVFNQNKSELQELAEYFMPRAARFEVNEKNKRRKKTRKIKDSTPFKALRNFSSGMMTSASSPATNWFAAGIKNFDVSGLNAAARWCNYLTGLFHNIISASNFYQVIPLVYRHMGVFGFGCLYGERNYKNVVHFKLIPPGSYRYAKNAEDEVDVLIRVYRESVRNIIEQFGKENVSERVKSLYEQKKLNEQVDICHYVAPNKDYMPKATWAKNKKFVSIYYELCADKSANKFLRHSGYDKFPYFIYESEYTGSDTYPSSCPGIEALADTKQLMEMIEDEAKGIKKIYSPTYRGPANLKGGVKDMPGGYIAEPDDSGKTVSPVHQVNPQFLGIHDLIEQKKSDIENAFYNDLFSIILNTQKGDRTAFEVNELKEEKLSLLAPLLNQVHGGHRAVFEWLFELVQEAGICPEPPEELIGKEFDIEFISTLTQARKAVKISGIERIVTYVTNLASQVDPTLRYKINYDKSIDEYAKLGNVDMSILRSDEEVNKIREAEAQKQAQEQAQQAMMNQLQQGSEIVKNIGGQDSYGAELLNRLGVG